MENNALPPFDHRPSQAVKASAAASAVEGVVQSLRGAPIDANAGRAYTGAAGAYELIVQMNRGMLP